jgi:hypothetical protein
MNLRTMIRPRAALFPSNQAKTAIQQHELPASAVRCPP